MSTTDLAEENERLRQRIAELEAKLAAPQIPTDPVPPVFEKVDQLTNAEIRRYGRQLILPHYGKEAQLKLRNTSMLIVGAGGLGAPAALFLGAGGVGRLGIVDHDDVDISNLHRQIIHTEARQGINKAVSAMMGVHSINPHCEVIPYALSLDSSNALDIIRQYDIVLDCTDNIATRYLLSDACVLSGKPLVSGSALRFDGQLTVYNYKGGPCFRCLHPIPPPADTVGRCSDSGVLGVIPGVIGTLQALEAIKTAVGANINDPPTMLIFSGWNSHLFRTMKLRGKKKDCAACGENPTITHLIDYVQFCGSEAADHALDLSILAPHERIDVKEYDRIRKEDEPHLLIDVRPRVQFDICSLPNSWNIPLDELEARMAEIKDKMSCENVTADRVYSVCRLGNDSQLAIRLLEKHGIQGGRDIVGGLYKWSMDVDETFPVY
ncbi:Molybdenum cofactor synthesis protein 3 [Apophysomyces ossiformis]|uniref:Needs CLA4 to survive protein 3 n=1 Tax=Apophysomyces ossiformis TaxID=679940 RepID=A0A8H7BS95_9FUNG|nr:Molybdenum cofactor synthesis protein 3 [Apophysomyces ossiformis]